MSDHSPRWAVEAYERIGADAAFRADRRARMTPEDRHTEDVETRREEARSALRIKINRRLERVL